MISRITMLLIRRIRQLQVIELHATIIVDTIQSHRMYFRISRLYTKANALV